MISVPHLTSHPMAESSAGPAKMRHARDPDSFRELYERHHERVYGLAWRMCGDRRQAEDLTQDVFVRLWASLDSYRGESAFTTWLHRLAVNVIWSELLRERRANGWLEPTDGDARDLSASHAERIAVRIDFERALATLPHGARTILLLYSVDGYGYREISQALGVDIGTVKSQLHRARRLLQSALS